MIGPRTGSAKLNVWAEITERREVSHEPGRPAEAGYLGAAFRRSMETDQLFVAACSALADPVRASVVQLLAHRDMSAGEIAAYFPVSRPAVSRHLAVLLKSQLLTVRSQSGRRVYSLDVDRLDAISAWVSQCSAHRRPRPGRASYSR
jgi:DNA-binding transcriptional ArsR family regulator